MIISIAVNGRHDIGLDAYGRFILEDKRISKKNVPFVRYRFKNYGDEELLYIERMKKKFNFSAHLLEITLQEGIEEQLNKVQNLEHVVKFVYLDIYNGDVERGLSEDKLEWLKCLIGKDIDRLMIRDRSTNLFSVAADRIRKEISDLGLSISDVGVCQSPLSINGNQCLSALKAREMAAKYAQNDNIALPTAGHEGNQTCGCIRYQLIKEDILAPVRLNNTETVKRVVKVDGKVKKQTKKKVNTKNVFIKW